MKFITLLYRKHFWFIGLFIVLATLFAVVPKSISVANETEFVSVTQKLEILEAYNSHPLVGLSDNVSICPNDGQEMHEIFLCGADDTRLLAPTIPNAQSIVWEKYNEGSCPDVIENCARRSGQCSWTQQSSNTQYTVETAGEYRIVVTYLDGSFARFYFNVFENGLNPTPLVTNVDCGSDGAISINNVSTNYEFSINNGASWQSSNNFVISSSGSYDILIRRKGNASGCIFEVNDIIVGNNSINATATPIPIACNTSKGQIRVDIADASSNYIYKIFRGGSLVQSSGPITQNTYTFNNLNPGDYDIEVTLASISNCAWEGTATVDAFVPLVPNVVVTKNVDCGPGIISAAINGGVAPYQVSIDNGNNYTPFTNGNLTFLSIPTPGSYTVKIKDTNGCVITANPVQVVQEDIATYNITKDDNNCSGINDGEITFNVTNPKGFSITFSIDGGTTFKTTKTFKNLAPGTYQTAVKLEKAGGECVIPGQNITINAATPFIVQGNITQIIDCSNGSASMTASVTAGGEAPFLYSLNGVDFQTTTSFNGLGPGTYTLTAKDVNNCLATTQVVVNADNNPSNIVFDEINYNCAAGTVDVSLEVVDGTAPFSYAIIAPITTTSPTNTFTGLDPGTYTFEVTAADGCKIVRNYNVSDPIRLQLTTTLLNQVKCFNSATPDGRISFTVTDFLGTYNYKVTDGSGAIIAQNSGETTNTIELSDLPASTYTVAVTNIVSGCVIEESLTVEEPSQPLSISNLDVVPYNCGQEGSVRITAQGGWGGYRYSLELPDGTNTPNQNTPLIIGLDQEGTHTVYVTDINGCVLNTETFDLVYNDGPDLELDTANSNFCFQTNNKGKLTVKLLNGVQPLSYVVNGADPVAIPAGNTSFTLNNLSPNTYNIKVVDGTGCSTILDPQTIAGQLFVTPTLTRILGCGPTPDAQINLAITGGYPPYNIEVKMGTGAYTTATSPYTTANSGDYQFKVTDSKGCIFETTKVTIQPRKTVAVTTNVTKTRCGLDGTGAVAFQPTSGVAPFSYSFNGGPFTNQPLYTGLSATSYPFVVRDAAQCEFSGTVTIGADPAISVDWVNIDSQCPATPGGPMLYGDVVITNPTNTQGRIRIELVRVRNEADHQATGWEHVYRNYEGINPATDYQVAGQFQFKIKMFWEAWFFIRVTDARGCVYKSDYFFHDQPDLPTTYAGPARNPDGTLLTQSCANGGPIFDVEINNTADLIGPFEYILWPRNLEDLDGDGQPEISGWKPFDSPDNPHPSYNGAGMNIKVRLGPPRDNLIFGVYYRILVRDVGTGCLRWSNVGQIEAPSPSINVEVVSRGSTCWGVNDGKARFTVTNHDQSGDLEYRIYDAWNVLNEFKPWTAVAGNAPSVVFEVDGFPVRWWVVEVKDASGCIVGERFVTHRGDAPLELELLQKRDASCNFGGQIAVDALGGWYNDQRFNALNRMDYYPWRDYQYAFVPSDEVLLESHWQFESSVVVNPTAYDGVKNVYRVYTRDANNCVVELASPVTINLAPLPEITSLDIPDTCTVTSESYSITANTTGGVGVLEYIWNGEITTTPTKDLGPGTHTLEIKDENGCTDTETFTLYPRFSAQIITTQKISCDAADGTTFANDGEITFEVYGGTGDFTFEMTNPAGPTNNDGVFGGLSPSVNYQFRVIDNISGCIETNYQITLDEPQTPMFVVKTPIQNVSCFGADDGKIQILPQSNTNQVDAPYTYSLDGTSWQPSNLFQNLAPGTYTPRVKSKLNCIQTLADVVIAEPALLTLAPPNVSPFSCTGNNTLGLATVTASVNDAMGNPTGTGPYLYSFNGASFTSNNTLTLPYTNVNQTITINVRDGENCTDATTVVVPAAPKVAVDLIELQSMNCRDNAEIEITANYGLGNYEVVELPANTVVGTGAGPWTITIPKDNPGNYVYRVRDLSTGCTATVNYEILPYDDLEILASKTSDVSCFNGTDGAVSLSILGYVGDYGYTLYDDTNTVVAQSNNENTSTGDIIIDNLSAGTYYFVVLANEVPYCDETSSTVTVQSPANALNVTANLVTDLSCVPGNDAEIIVSGTGGWGGYQYKLIDANTNTMVADYQIDDVFSGLDAGSYLITVKDLNGCEVTMNVADAVEVVAITPIVVDNPPMVQQISCIGAADASITVTATGGEGVAFYSYVLNNLDFGTSSVPQLNNTFSNLVPGRYSITVKDNKGCDGDSQEVTIVDPFEVTIDAAISIEPTCLLEGEITLAAGGGSGNYEFRYFLLDDNNNRTTTSGWDTQMVYTLPSGTYEFVARDLTYGCESPLSVIRTLRYVEPLTIQVDNSAANLSCFGDTNATLIAEAFGGIGAYEYQLLDDNGNALGARQPNGMFENLGAGSYILAAFSDPDCSVQSDVIEIVEPQQLQAVISNQVNVACYGEETGSVILDVTGGTAPYTYEISTNPGIPENNSLFDNLQAGIYNILVEDAQGCLTSVDVTITEPNAPLSATVLEVSPEICSSDDNGSFSIQITGGTAPYEYSTTTPQGPFDTVSDPSALVIDNLDGGMQHVAFIKDANGCTTNVIQYIEVGVDLTSTVDTSYSCRNGSPYSSTVVEVLDSSLLADVLYILDSEDLGEATPNNVFVNLEPGNHYISVVHANGCLQRTEVFTITAPIPLELEIVPARVNEILVEASGGAGGYSYYFNGKLNSDNSYIIPKTGSYEVKVVDALGCETIIVIEMEFVDLYIPNFFTPNGDGENDIWELQNTLAYPNLYVMIFDRYGRKLHSFIGEGSWDGTLNNTDLPSGDYWYIIKLNGEEDKREFTGNITVYR